MSYSEFTFDARCFSRVSSFVVLIIRVCDNFKKHVGIILECLNVTFRRVPSLYSLLL